MKNLIINNLQTHTYVPDQIKLSISSPKVNVSSTLFITQTTNFRNEYVSENFELINCAAAVPTKYVTEPEHLLLLLNSIV